jgi:uncharacterized protein YyaL (SSP411 family)
MIKTLFVMAQYEPNYLKIANRRLNALISLMLPKDTLYHQTIADKSPTQKAQLEDYAYIIDTLITAHQVTLDKKHLTLASKLAHQAKKLFNQNGIWYMSIQNPKVRADFDDKYYSAPLSVLLNSFLTLANIHDDLELGEESNRVLKNYGKVLEDRPQESSSLVTLALRSKVGVVTLKAEKKELKRYQKEFIKIDYPFLLRKTHEYKEFMACKLGLCFATAKSFKDINTSIQRAKNEIDSQPKKPKWGAK